MASILKVNTIQDATNSNTSMTINSSGFAVPRIPTFSALTSGNVTVGSGYSDTKLTFDTEEWDVGGYFDTSTHRYTPLVAGYYLVTVSAGLTSTTPCRTKIFKNGSLERGSGSIDSAAYGYNNAIVNALVSMNGSSDYLEGYIQASSSGTVPSGKYITFFQAHLVGALS